MVVCVDVVRTPSPPRKVRWRVGVLTSCDCHKDYRRSAVRARSRARVCAVATAESVCLVACMGRGAWDAQAARRNVSPTA